MPERYLSSREAKAFYDRFGAKQDRQGWYEDAAIDALVAGSGFEHAESVLELGCGTGRLAERLLIEHLPATATYLGVDLSETMVALTRQRLARFGERAEVILHDGDDLPTVSEGTIDRVVSTYVLDLLPEGEIQRALSWAASATQPGSRLCLAGITPGRSGLSRLVMGLWQLVFRWNPQRVGGCRPMTISNHLDPADWAVEHREVVAAWGIASEVVVARRQLGGSSKG